MDKKANKQGRIKDIKPQNNSFMKENSKNKKKNNNFINAQTNLPNQYTINGITYNHYEPNFSELAQNSFQINQMEHANLYPNIKFQQNPILTQNPQLNLMNTFQQNPNLTYSGNQIKILIFFFN